MIGDLIITERIGKSKDEKGRDTWQVICHGIIKDCMVSLSILKEYNSSFNIFTISKFTSDEILNLLSDLKYTLEFNFEHPKTFYEKEITQLQNIIEEAEIKENDKRIFEIEVKTE